MSLVLLLFTVGAWSQATAQATGQKANFTIDSIHIEGNRILSADAILSASGLMRGVPGNSGVFDAARDRLLSSGYFRAVSYRYKPATSDAGYEVIFTVAEEPRLYPIRVDAIGATTEEIASYLKTQDPLFTGKMPGTTQVVDRAIRQIEQYLKSNQRPAKVAGRVVAIAPDQLEIDFTPEHGLPAVSTVTFEGAKVISATDLRSKIAEVAFGQPFTEDGFRVFLENQIRPLYEAKGYMHVTFPKIAGAPATDVLGVQVLGVDVKVTVDEGALYKISGVTVGPRMASDSARILKTARLTGFDELTASADRVRFSMRHQGYLDAEVITENKRDDEKKTVVFVIDVDAGPEYKFGNLTVLGLTLDGEAAIRRMWGVKTGDPFPAEYPNIFVKKVREENLFENLGGATADPQIDRTSHIVNVALDFKYG